MTRIHEDGAPHADVRSRPAGRVLATIIAGLACVASILPTTSAAEPAGQATRLPQAREWTGDFDGILKRRTLRILVPYSKTLYFVDRGKQMGVVAEFGRELETAINTKHGFKTLRFHVAFVPTARDQLFSALLAGKGDAIAGNLTVTPERQTQADFTTPWMQGVKEIVVTGPASPKLDTLDDLAGTTVHLRKSSSYFDHVAKLSQDLVAKGKKPIDLKAADENLEDEDLLEMVNAGLFPFAIVDDHKADIWTKIYDKLKARPDLAVSSGGDIAWAIRKNSPALKAELDGFFSTHKAGTSFGNTIKRRYFSDTKVVRNALADDSTEKFKQLAAVFLKYGKQFNFDPIMIIAQSFQELQLDQKRKSPVGAVGLMQIKPSTAAGKPIGITGIAESADKNVNAGAAYLRYLADNYVNDPGISPKDQTLMAFAAYNAGPGNLRKFRAATVKAGLDQNVWFNNVEQGAAQVVGRETVQYVSNIYKYYVAYDLLWQRMQASEKSASPAAAK